MNACFSKPSPSHPAETVASFQVPKIFSILPRIRWIGWFQASDGKPIYAVYYDDQEAQRGELNYGVTQYFGTKKSRSLLSQNIAVAMVPVSDAAPADESLAAKSMEKTNPLHGH